MNQVGEIVKRNTVPVVVFSSLSSLLHVQRLPHVPVMKAMLMDDVVESGCNIAVRTGEHWRESNWREGFDMPTRLASRHDSFTPNVNPVGVGWDINIDLGTTNAKTTLCVQNPPSLAFASFLSRISHWFNVRVPRQNQEQARLKYLLRRGKCP